VYEIIHRRSLSKKKRRRKEESSKEMAILQHATRRNERKNADALKQHGAPVRGAP